MPRRLAKGAKRKGGAVIPRCDCTSRLRLFNVGHEFRLEYVDSGHSRLERAETGEGFWVAVIASHSYGGNLTCLLADVRTARTQLTVGRYRPSGIRSAQRAEEIEKRKIRVSLNYLVWLTAGTSDPGAPTWTSRQSRYIPPNV